MTADKAPIRVSVKVSVKHSSVLKYPINKGF